MIYLNEEFEGGLTNFLATSLRNVCIIRTNQMYVKLVRLRRERDRKRGKGEVRERGEVVEKNNNIYKRSDECSVT